MDISLDGIAIVQRLCRFCNRTNMGDGRRLYGYVNSQTIHRNENNNINRTCRVVFHNNDKPDKSTEYDQYTKYQTKQWH